MNNFNLITSGQAGWTNAYDMFYVMFEHGMTYVWDGMCGQRESNV